MKKSLFLAALLGCTMLLQAQSVNDEADMHTFARNFMTAYHEGDLAALRKMYTDDAVRIDAQGKQINGADNIAAYFADQFRLNNATLLLKQMSLTWSDFEQAWVAKGTYEIYGKTNVYDIKIDFSGHYANAMIKQDGEWKIAKSVFSPLVKVLVYHKVKDFAQWKSAFEQGRPMRLAAGELRSEIGTLDGDPKTAYVISEWTSLENFQTFFANPDLGKAMQQAGVTEKPAVVILDRK